MAAARRCTDKSALKKLRKEWHRETIVDGGEFDATRANPRVRDKAMTVAELTLSCAVFPGPSEAAGDLWGFTPGADTVSNVWRKPGASPALLPASTDSQDPPRIPSTFFIWRSPESGALGKPGRPTSGMRAYLPWNAVEDHAFVGNNRGFKSHFVAGESGWRGTPDALAMVEHTHYFELFVATCGSGGAWRPECKGKREVQKQYFIDADTLRSKLTFRSHHVMYRGWDLALPTANQACALELDAEGLCGGVKRALDLAPHSHGNDRPRIASALAPFISATTWVAAGYGSKYLYRNAVHWYAEHGRCIHVFFTTHCLELMHLLLCSCQSSMATCCSRAGAGGLEFEDEVDMIFERPGGTCRDNKTPYQEAFHFLEENFFSKYSKQCPWMGSSGTGGQAGILFDINIWTLPFTYVCTRTHG